MAWLTGSLIENGWLTGALDAPINNIKIVIDNLNPVVDIFGQPVTHTYDYWFITQDDIDLANYNAQPVTVINRGDNLSIVNGEGEVSVNLANIGQSYRLVAFDDDESNYFRYTGTATEEV